MSETTIKLRATRDLWHAGQVIRAGETFKVDNIDAAQTAVGSGRAVCADEIEAANLHVAAAKERDRLAHWLARR